MFKPRRIVKRFVKLAIWPFFSVNYQRSDGMKRAILMIDDEYKALPFVREYLAPMVLPSMLYTMADPVWTRAASGNIRR